MATIEHVRNEERPRIGRERAEPRPILCFVYSSTSGPSRRADGFLAQVLQRRQNHRAFVLQRIDCVERPDLTAKLGATTVPALVIVEGRRVRARLEGLSGCKEIEQFLDPWLASHDAEANDGEAADRDGEAADAVLESPVTTGPQESFARVSMGLPSNLPFGRWRLIGERICGVADASTWWLPDWVVFGEQRYGDRYRDAVAITGVGYQTLRNYAWVARRVDVSRRRDDLSFAHHAEVAALSPEEQDSWLDRAEAERWSRNELRAELRRTRPSQDSSKVEHLRLDVSTARAARWRNAAKAAGALELPGWIISVADDASVG
jgi:hypothetical protein